MVIPAITTPKRRATYTSKRLFGERYSGIEFDEAIMVGWTPRSRI
jgi:hypothetical protein